jgi:hypothetical protein
MRPAVRLSLTTSGGLFVVAILGEMERTDFFGEAWSWWRVGLWWMGLMAVFALLLILNGGQTTVGSIFRDEHQARPSDPWDDSEES